MSLNSSKLIVIATIKISNFVLKTEKSSDPKQLKDTGFLNSPSRFNLNILVI